MHKNPHSGGFILIGYPAATTLLRLDNLKANRTCPVQKVDNS